MNKSIVLVAALAALAGCQGKSNQDTAKASPPVQSQSSGAATDPTSPTNPTKPTYGYTGGLSGSQSGSAGDEFSSTAARDAGGSSSSRSTVESPSSDLDSSASAPAGSDKTRRTDRDLQRVGDFSGTPSDATSSDQHGSVLTEKGVKTLPSDKTDKADAGGGNDSASASKSTAPSMNDSAAQDADRSSELPSDLRTGTTEATRGLDQGQDLSQIPAKVEDQSANAANSMSDHLQTDVGDEATLGETDTDRALVQSIRQAVVNDETLSSAARSVQIRSVNNQVILKGSVDNEREKVQIGTTAFRASGGKQVLNQLEVTNR